MYEEKIQEFIDEKERNSSWVANWIELLGEATWIEKETTEKIKNRLKNDKNLLDYAELFTKTEKLNIWDTIKLNLLNLKLSITCAYFSDFKEFLIELKRWPHISTWWTDNTQQYPVDNPSNNHEETDTSKNAFCWTNVNDILSEPFEKNSRTWVTWCSKTARYNWKNFWLELPSGNAFDAGKLPWKDTLLTIPENKKWDKPQSSWEWIHISDFKSKHRWNFADIYVNSKSNYGHRAVAFKDNWWQWYILDPYTRVNWDLNQKPKKLEDYLNVKKIVKIHFYESEWYSWSTTDIYD